LAPFLLGLDVQETRAQSIACGEPYIVQPGDSLQRIAERAYGPEGSYRDLIEDNLQNFIGGDPSRIAVGLALDIPCRAVEGPAVQRVIGGAMVDATGEMAMLAAAMSLPMDDRSSPVEPASLPDRLARAGSPRIAGLVPRPNCEFAELGAEGRALCDQLAWSEPVDEVVLSAFTLAAAGPITRDEALAESMICTSETTPTYLYADRPFGAAQLSRRLPTTADCFTALRAGAVEAVLAPAPEADAAMASLDVGAEILEQFALSRLYTVHAVALAEDSASLALIDTLNEILAAR
jgi:hypothetical protein